MLRRFTDFLLKNRLNAIIVTLVCAFIPIIGSASILIAGLVTLRKGMFEGALVLFASCMPYIVSYFTYPNVEGLEIALAAIVIMVISNILTWFFAVMLRAKNSWSFTLQIAGVMGAIFVVAVHLIYPDIQGFWQTKLTVYFEKTASMVNKIKEGTNPADTTAELVTIAKQYATGFIVLCVLFNAFLQLLIARWWQSALFSPGSLKQELYRIRFGYLLAALFIVGIVLSYQSNPIALDSMTILYGIFCIAGLSLIHSLIGLAELNWLWLILIYIGAIWLFPLSVLLLSVVGLLDVGFDIRKRLGNKIS